MAAGIRDFAEPEVTVLVISDYAGGEEKTWDDIRKTLSGLAAQDFSGTAEYVLVESIDLAPGIPQNLTALLPGLRIEIAAVPHTYGTSYLLKNYGVECAHGKFVAILDADCVPASGWLSAAVSALRARPEAAAVSGMTVYEGRGLSERVLAVLSRAYLDQRGRQGTRFVSNNNCLVRRDVYLANPLPTEGGPFAARIQSDALRAAGHFLAFEPAMRVTHDFEGWEMERDIRRNIGWATIRVRQIDPSVSHTWVLRLGPLAPLLFFAAHVAVSWGSVLRVGRHYGLRLIEYPIAMLAALYVHGLEFGGMRAALADESLGETAYR